MPYCSQFWIFLFARKCSPLRRISSTSRKGLQPLAQIFFLQEKRYFYAVLAYFRSFLLLNSNLSNL